MRKFVLLLLTTSVGCATVGKPGVAIVKSPPDAEAIPFTVMVPQTGRYELRREGGTPHEIPLATVELANEERIGFDRRPDGTLIAKAGPAEFQTSEGSYYWSMAKESTLTGPRLRWYYAKQTGKGLLLGTGILLVSALVVVGAFTLVFISGYHWDPVRGSSVRSY